MAFIDTIPDSDINADVRAMYERQQSFWGFVPNYATRVLLPAGGHGRCGRSCRPASSRTWTSGASSS